MTPLKAVSEAEQAAEAVLLRFPELTCVIITCGVAHILRERAVNNAAAEIDETDTASTAATEEGSVASLSKLGSSSEICTSENTSASLGEMSAGGGRLGRPLDLPVAWVRAIAAIAFCCEASAAVLGCTWPFTHIPTAALLATPPSPPPLPPPPHPTLLY